MPDYKFHTLSKSNIFRPNQPTPLQRFLHNPLTFLATWLYTHQPRLISPPLPPTQEIKVVCISDTHNEIPSVPPGDIPLHAGDLTQNGTFAEVQAQINWLHNLPHALKIVIAGNHDLILDDAFVASAPSRVFKTKEGSTKEELQWRDVVYLEHASITVNVRGQEVKVFGSPFTPKYGNWAFQYANKGRDIWQGTIPIDTDIVVTHGPPKGHLDANGTGHAGCPRLNSELYRVKPKLFVCGHIHEARGRKDVCWDAVQRMYDAALGCPTAGLFVFEAGVLHWIWRWVTWMFGVRRELRTTLMNASTVGHWGVAEGMVTEI